MAGPDGESKLCQVVLSDTAKKTVDELDEGQYQGHRIRLQRVGGTGAEISLILAWDRQLRLVVQEDQTEGKDHVAAISDLYSFSIKPRDDS